MTVARPAPPPEATRRRRWGVLLAVAVLAGLIGWLAWGGLGDALVYYLTPTELLARGTSAVGHTVRLGGLVETGSLQGPATDLTFVLTDGQSSITVHSSVAPPTSFRDGRGAVVEGQLRSDGVFEAELVIVRHDENYVAPTLIPSG